MPTVTESFCSNEFQHGQCLLDAVVDANSERAGETRVCVTMHEGFTGQRCAGDQDPEDKLEKDNQDQQRQEGR